VSTKYEQCVSVVIYLATILQFICVFLLFVCCVLYFRTSWESLVLFWKWFQTLLFDIVFYSI